MKKIESVNSSHSSQSSNELSKLTVYIRNNKKQAIIIQTKRQANLHEISKIIQAKLKVPINDQILCYEGQIVTSDTQQLQVADKSIIHLIDRRNINPEINIRIRRLRCSEINQYRISSQYNIQEFLEQQFASQDPSNLFLVYTGRQLLSSSSFAEEFVENESQIFCLHNQKDEVTGKKKEEYQKKIKNGSKLNSASNDKKQELKSRPQISQQKQSNAYEQQNSKNILENKNTPNILTPKIISSIDQNCKQVQSDGQQQDEVVNSHVQSSPESKVNLNQEVSAPNFKKKNKTQEINLGNDQNLSLLNVQQANISISIQNPIQSNPSLLQNSGFYDEDHSISSIAGDETHNPQNMKRQNQNSQMFNSVYVGLNSEISNPQFRNESNLVVNEQKNNSNIIKEQSLQKSEFSFDICAPEIMIEKMKIEQNQIQQENQSRQDYSEQVIKHKQQQQIILNENTNQQRLSQALYKFDFQNNEENQIDRKLNHHLDESASLEDRSPEKSANQDNKNNQNEIVVKQYNSNIQEKLQNEEQQQKYVYEGIEMTGQAQTQQAKNLMINVRSEVADVFIEKQLIQTNQNLNTSQQIRDGLEINHLNEQEMLQNLVMQKQISDDIQTNGRESGSQFYSYNSSRVKNNFNQQSNQFLDRIDIAAQNAKDINEEFLGNDSEINQEYQNEIVINFKETDSINSDEEEYRKHNVLYANHDEQISYHGSHNDSHDCKKDNQKENHGFHSQIDELNLLFSQMQTDNFTQNIPNTCNESNISNKLFPKDSLDPSVESKTQFYDKNEVSIHKNEKQIKKNYQYKMSIEEELSPLKIKAFSITSYNSQNSTQKYSKQNLDEYLKTIQQSKRSVENKVINIGDLIFVCEFNTIDPLSMFLSAMQQVQMIN